MRRLLIALFAAVLAILPIRAQVLNSSDFTLDGYYNLQTFGLDSTYQRALTSRHVAGELRFLTLTHTGILQEFSITGKSFGQTVTTTTATWNVSAYVGDFTGIYYSEATNRLFITSAIDYPDGDAVRPAVIKIMTLGAAGALTNVKRVTVTGIPDRRMYGGVLPIPTKWQTLMAGNKYITGWGGYSSRLTCCGGAPIGPTMYAIPDPDLQADGGSVTPKVILDVGCCGYRGYRKTIPWNYFDGGDQRPNPSSPPTIPPVSQGAWLSPNDQGKGWMVWGDSYYNNATIILDTYIAVAAICGVTGQTSPSAGGCWYQDSTLHFDGRTQEMHTWDMAGLDGTNPILRPTAMAELNLARGYTAPFSGDVAATNVSGVTYDATGNKLYMVIYGSGTNVNTGRLYQFSVNTGGSPVTPPDPPPPPTAVDCVGAWSAPVVIATSTCVNQQQNVTTERTYTVTTPASGGGQICAAATGDKTHNTVVQACNVPNPCASPVLKFQVTQWPNNTGRTSGAWNISGQVGQWSVTFGVGRNPRTATAVDSRGLACAITLNKF